MSLEKNIDKAPTIALGGEPGKPPSKRFENNIHNKQCYQNVQWKSVENVM